MQYDAAILAKTEKLLKRIERSFNYLDKRFDLGFISEKEFDQRRRMLVRKYAGQALADSNLHLKDLKAEIRQRRLGITRWTQYCIKVLAEHDGLQRIGELEQALHHLEELLELALTRRKYCEENIKSLNALIDKAS